MRSTIHARLKSETQAIHAEVEKLSHAEAIMSHTLSQTGYKNLLAVNYAFHCGIHQAIHIGFSSDMDTGLCVTERSQHHAALKNLQICHAATLPSRIDALSRDLSSNHSSILTTPCQPPQLSTLAQAFGAMYVVQGSMLGGAVIHRALQKNPSLKPCQPFRFYSSFGSETGPQWKQFCIALAEHVTTADDAQEATTKALETFEFFKAILLI